MKLTSRLSKKHLLHGVLCLLAGVCGVNSGEASRTATIDGSSIRSSLSINTSAVSLLTSQITKTRDSTTPDQRRRLQRRFGLSLTHPLHRRATSTDNTPVPLPTRFTVPHERCDYGGKIIAGPNTRSHKALSYNGFTFFSIAESLHLALTTSNYDNAPQLLKRINSGSPTTVTVTINTAADTITVTGTHSQCFGNLFQGLWTDPVTGIAYARNRWYDARNASWLSEDPMGAVDSVNLYAFVGWGPHMGRDPMGLNVKTMEVPCSMVEIGCNPNTGTRVIDYGNMPEPTIQPVYSPEWGEENRKQLAFAVPPVNDVEIDDEAMKQIGLFATQIVLDTVSDGFEFGTGYNFRTLEPLSGKERLAAGVFLGLPFAARGVLDDVVEIGGDVVRRRGDDVSTGAANARRGNAFERKVLESLGLPKNKDIYIGKLPSGAFKTTIPDIVKSGKFGIADIKDVNYASFTKQLQAQSELADYFKKPFSLIVSSTTQKVSLPLQRAIQISGGKVLEFDSATGALLEVGFDLNKPNRIVR